jgi:hypothetical protein
MRSTKARRLVAVFGVVALMATACAVDDDGADDDAPEVA